MVHHEVLPATTLTAEKGVFTTYASTTIRAEPQEVWKVVSDPSTYPRWNRFTPSVGLAAGKERMEVGDICELSYNLDGEPEKATKMPVEILEVDEEGMRLAWRGMNRGFPKWLLHPEKVQRVTPLASGGAEAGEAQTSDRAQCVFELWETFAGPMSHVVKLSVGSKLDSMGQGIADGLKEYVEGRSV